MSGSKSTFVRALIALTALIAVHSTQTSADPRVQPVVPQPSGSVRIQIKPLPEGTSRVFLVTSEDGQRQFEIVRSDRTTIRLSAEEFAEMLYANQSGESWLFRMLNITSPVGFAWVFVGLLGQLLFSGRLLLQWLISERARRSVVPAGYWWMSLVGASMLLVYFIWRRDIIGILGQTTGWLIYSRNLWMIYAPTRHDLPATNGN